MKSYISKKFPLETRMTDQTFDFRSAERLMVSNWCSESLTIVVLTCLCQEVDMDSSRHSSLRNYNFKDESTTNFACRASLAEDCRVAAFPPSVECLVRLPDQLQSQLNLA